MEGDASLRLRRTEPALRLRRTWPQRFVIVGGMGLVVTSLAAAWGLADAYDSVGEIKRYAVPDGLLAEPPTNDPGGPRNILLVGSTENEGIDENDPLVVDRVDTRLADTIIVLRVEPSTQRAMLLTINRDLDVPEGPWGFNGKINEAYSIGAIDKLAEVVQGYLGIEVNDFAIVNFAGFRSLVDELGGVPVYFEHPMRDDDSFFATDAGCHVLDGQPALDYLRGRKMKIDGDDDGDFEAADTQSDRDRTQRQRDFLLLAMQRAIDKGARDPRRLNEMLDAINREDAVVLDDKLSPSDIIDIAQAFGDFTPESLQRYSIVTRDAKRGRASILELDVERTRPFIDLINGHGESTTNEDVRVAVEEARAPSARSADVAPPLDELAQLGFRVTAKTAKEADRREQTTIIYSPDQDRFALLIARNLAVLPRFEAVAGREKLTLSVGADWRGVTLVPKAEGDVAGALRGAGVATTAPPAAGDPLPGATTTSGAVTTTSPPADVAAGIIGADPTGGLCDPD